MNTATATKYVAGHIIASKTFASHPGYGVAIEAGKGRNGADWFRVARLAPFLGNKYFSVSDYFTTEVEARKAANELWSTDLAALNAR
jgi:NAD(P)H-hydrate repair Nnr-like enzyme with NAD(P)H-hydrate epimerase domain